MSGARSIIECSGSIEQGDANAGAAKEDAEKKAGGTGSDDYYLGLSIRLVDERTEAHFPD